MANTSLVKNILYKSLAEGVFKDVVTRSSSFYYFLGKTLSWDDENNPPLPVDSYSYEREVRNEVITIKEIKPSDVAFVIQRRDWVSDIVYDMYDDRYSDQVLGINIISGGSGFINVDDITITITGGGGSGATAVAVEAYRGGISKIVLTNPGSGYTSEPTVTVASASGSGAVLRATMGISANNFQKIEDANFYVVTDDYNVYKCLDNNNAARSTYKPTGTQLDPIKTLDGYIWKFMYNIPINLRNKFYTDEYIPVVTALTNHFYSNGTIDNIFIANKGKNYTSAVVSVTGDGYREADPLYINDARIVAEGTGYTNPTVDFSPPYGASSAFISGNSVNLGQVLYNQDSYDYYEVVTPGVMSTVAPTHRFGVVQNGTAALKYVGTKLKGYITTRNDKNITRIELTNPGVGYTSVPTVTITDSTGVNATATARIGSSTVQSVTIVDGGSGYLNPAVEAVGGGGSGAILQAIVTAGVITNVIVINAGQGYTSAPTLIVTDNAGTGADLNAVISGSPILSIDIVNGGSGYTSPSVAIDGGGGAAAAANAVVETGVIDDVFLYGAIREVVVLNSGSGYIEPPEVVIGNAVNSVEVLDGGTGYTAAPDIILKGGGGYGATATANVVAGVITEIIITNRGAGYTSPPQVVLSGGGGSGAQAVSHLASGSYAVVKSKLYSDKVISTYVVNPGDNYVEAPSVVFGKSYEQGLEVYSSQQYSFGNYLYTVVEHGFFGSTAPTWTSGTQFTSPAWEANTAVEFGQTVYINDRMYTVVTAGTTGSTAPTHTTGIDQNGSADLEFVGKPASLRRDGEVATGYAVLRYGAGYSVTPSVTFNDSTGTGAEINFLTSKSEAKISAITEDGQITYLVIEDPGVGYTKAAITVSGGGTGASLIPDLSLGSVSSQQANNEILTPAGTIDAIAIVSGGYSYGVANIAIEGDGTGATAEAVIDKVTNAIVKVKITNRGQDYTYANVKVIGNGQGAELRAIISPYGGHGKNSPEELYSRSLMFYSNISTDLNQGVIVGNDYRQVGILKNPRVFDGFEKFQGSIGSAAYIIQSPINTTRFAKDDDLFIERVTHPNLEWAPSLQLTIGDFVWYEDRIYTVVVSGLGGSTPPVTTTGSEQNGFAVLTYVGSTKSKKRYRIVAVTETTALLQSLDNDIPSANDVFVKTTSITDNFTALSVGLPSFDKYSGQLMYIDNKQGFTPSGDETITLRTIIKF